MKPLTAGPTCYGGSNTCPQCDELEYADDPALPSLPGLLLEPPQWVGPVVRSFI